MQHAEYEIDFYQREYIWERRNIEELLDDFESVFSAAYNDQHERSHVRQYPRYFLGTIITFTREGKKQIVDGQQRLTTLTLLLIYFHHQRNENSKIADVSHMVFSDTYGEKSFNIDVPERSSCMSALFETGNYETRENTDISITNLVQRYTDIQLLFPDSLKNHALPLFVDWMINNVDFVQIDTSSDNDAFTVFETMNDRGVSLGPVDMLKGYLLAQITRDSSSTARSYATAANDKWRQRIVDLFSVAPKEDQAFFKAWLRAKYAVSARGRYKGAANRDFENVDKFHRWVRDNTQKVGLLEAHDFHEFIMERFIRFSDCYLELRHASTSIKVGLEEVYYNAYNNFTLQYMLAMAPVTVEDGSSIARKKMHLVSIFSDIYLARRMVNRKSIGRNTLQYWVFNLTKRIRDISVEDLRIELKSQLGQMDEGMEGITESNEGPFRLHGRNNNHTRYLLSRITAWIEHESGKSSDFLTYARPSGKPYEIEHIWADKFEDYQDIFENESEFHHLRNHIGGLVLLPRGTNQSFGADSYDDKVRHYLKENLLAASLHPETYERNPNFTNFVERSGLPFIPHEHFTPEALWRRQELYRQICERIWSPDRLDKI